MLHLSLSLDNEQPSNGYSQPVQLSINQVGQTSAESILAAIYDLLQGSQGRQGVPPAILKPSSERGLDIQGAGHRGGFISTARRPRLLCLHGKGSNQGITDLQLIHLGLDKAFDATHLKGPYNFHPDTIVTDEDETYYHGNRGVGQETLYSWTMEDESGRITVESFLESARSVLQHVQDHGPYDAVYGFSQGAALATLLSSRDSRTEIASQLGLSIPNHDPWKFVFCGCAAPTTPFRSIASHLGLDLNIKLPSAHFIGLSDLQFKSASEEVLSYYDPADSLTFYIDSEHEITQAATETYRGLQEEALNAYWQADRGSVGSEYAQMNKELAHLIMSTKKAAGVRHTLDTGNLLVGRQGQYAVNQVQSSKSSLMAMLLEVPDKRLALCSPGKPSLTYAGLMRFIKKDGDLRRFGAKQDHIIAYVAPVGVLSAVAFLTITSQCTSVPMDPSYSHDDYIQALQQTRPNFVVIFEGVDTNAVASAAESLNIPIIMTANIPNTCGLFRFVGIEGLEVVTSRRLTNRANGDALILRTSGTTSKPKVVPLKMWSVVSNAKAIAKNLGLTSFDVALNAMPLFHIGGLSSNLLSSLAAGGTVILMDTFDPETFLDLLSSDSTELPRPTWYSSVPTMHSAICDAAKQRMAGGKGRPSHSLKFIRSGADKMPHKLAVDLEETFGCPTVLTYSMTEQMPISHPPTGYSITKHKPNSVGKPLVASMMIVDENMQPLPYGSESPKVGEVCISGDMVIQAYGGEESEQANAKSFFVVAGKKWFRTGDHGYLDRDGFLFLTGRMKNLIKRGGDQINPLQVEEVLNTHPDIHECYVFPIPDDVWGERVGVAVILNNDSNPLPNEADFVRALRRFALDSSSLKPTSLPETVVFTRPEDIPRTATKKVIRNQAFATAVGYSGNGKFHASGGEGGNRQTTKSNTNTSIELPSSLDGLRFVLALAVNYVHIGNFDGVKLDEWSASESEEKSNTLWSHTRSWCIHTPLFFFVGGFLLANGTGSVLSSKRSLFRFYSLRLLSLHPMYLVSILWCIINWTVRCQPDNFIKEFQPDREPLEDEYFTCQATPVEMPYGATLATSIFVYVFGLQAWPFAFPFAWFLSSYTWFSSVYYACILAFPLLHRYFWFAKDDLRAIWKLVAFWLVALYAYMGVVGAFLGIEDDNVLNFYGLSAYLFPVGWFPCFSLGIAAYFLFTHYRPSESPSGEIWGRVSDVITLMFFAIWLCYGLLPTVPNPNWTDAEIRLWDGYFSRIYHPVGIIWFWGIASGKGFTARLFSTEILSRYLAPGAYNMFLFHQPVSETYFVITRGIWWAYPKTFYWFSPYPVPVEIWEFPIVIAIVIAVSLFMDRYVNNLLIASIFAVKSFFSNTMKSDGTVGRNMRQSEDVTASGVEWDVENGGSLAMVLEVVDGLTDVDVDERTGLIEAGISSMMTAVLVSLINEQLARKNLSYRLGAPDLARLDTVADLADHIDKQAGIVASSNTSSSSG